MWGLRGGEGSAASRAAAGVYICGAGSAETGGLASSLNTLKKNVCGHLVYKVSCLFESCCFSHLFSFRNSMLSMALCQFIRDPSFFFFFFF